MSGYVHFSLTDCTGIQKAVLDNMTSFQHWLHRIKQTYPEDYKADFIEMTDQLVRQQGQAFHCSNSHQANLIDSIVNELVGFYLDIEQIELFEDNTPEILEQKRYPISLRSLDPQCPEAVEAYYQRCFSGRSLARYPRHQYQADHRDGYRLSWLTPDEAESLVKHISQYIQSLEQNHHWYKGLCCFQQALNQALERQKSLVIEIR